jgi:hypothetical protein
MAQNWWTYGQRQVAIKALRMYHIQDDKKKEKIMNVCAALERCLLFHLIV